MNKSKKGTEKLYVVAEDFSHRLVDDKSKATKFYMKEAKYRLGSYSNAKIETVDDNLSEQAFSRNYIVVVEKDKFAKGGSTAKFGKLPKSRQADKKYTHFAVGNADGKILNGWDYKGYDAEELSSEKKHYYYDDMNDMDYKKSEYTIQTAKKLISKGINPYDFDNWRKIDYSTNESSYDTKFPERKMAKGGDITKKPTQSQLNKMTAFNLMDAMKNDKKNYQLYKKQLLKLYPDAKGFALGGNTNNFDYGIGGL